MIHALLLITGVIFYLLSAVIFTKPAFADNQEIITQINQFRASKNIPAVQADPLTCSFAALRVKEISTDFTHNGFYDRAKSKSMPYPRYKLATENLARTSKHNAVEMWIKSPKHAANMLKNTPVVCVESYGDYYAYEGLAI